MTAGRQLPPQLVKAMEAAKSKSIQVDLAKQAKQCGKGPKDGGKAIGQEKEILRGGRSATIKRNKRSEDKLKEVGLQTPPPKKRQRSSTPSSASGIKPKAPQAIDLLKQKLADIRQGMRSGHAFPSCVQRAKMVGDDFI